MRQIKIDSGSWQMDLELIITIEDEDKFNNECISINKFFAGDAIRKEHHGSHEKAGIALFAAECFQLMAFNNLKDEEWLSEQFDWSKGKGVEGFPSIKELGIKIDRIDPWFIDSYDVEIKGID